MAGETTSSSTINTSPTWEGGPCVVGAPWSASYATGELEANDVKNIGYLAAGVTVIGFAVSATDMDSNGTPTLAQKITVGSTDLVTGIQDGRAGTSAFYACVPTTLTAKSLVKVTNTAASATAVAGTLYVTPLFISN